MPSAGVVGPHHHDGRVPADEGPDAALDVLVAGEPRLLVGRDGVDVGRGDGGREADLVLPGPLEQLHEQEAGPGLAVGVDDGVEGVEPLGRLLGVDVRQLVGEPVEDHPSIVALIRGRPVPDFAAGCDGAVPGWRGGTSATPTPPSCTPTAPAWGIPARAGGPGPCPAAATPAAPRPAPPTSAWRSRPPWRPSPPSTGRVEVVSDSTYVVNCFRDRWWEGWLARGWLNSQKKPVANRDLWEPLIDAYRADPDRLRFRWVKGHSDDPMNDLVDRLAVEAASTQRGRQGEGTPDRDSDRRTGPAAAGDSDAGRCRHRRHLHRRRHRHGQVVKLTSVPADPARPVAEGVRRGRRSRGAGPRHHGGDQRPPGAAGRAGGAHQHRGAARRHRDRPPSPAVAVRPVGGPARSRSCRAICASRWPAGWMPRAKR